MSDDTGALPPWQRPDNYGLAAHNRLVRRVNVQGLSPAGEIEIMAAPSGSGIVDRRQNRGSSPFKILRVSTSITFPATLAIGWYWAVVQQRNSIAIDPTVNLSITDYYEDPPGATVVLLYNDVESLALIRTIPYANSPHLIAWKTGLTADVVPAAGPPAVTYDVYGTKGLMLTC